MRDLTARERQCCSFFTFTLEPADTPAGEAVTLHMTGAARHRDVLDALTDQANAGLR